MLNENQTEKENQLDSEKRTIFDVMEGVAVSTSTKAIFVSLIALFALSVFLFIAIINSINEIEFTNVLLIFTIISAVMQLFIIIPFAMIIHDSKKRIQPSLGITLLNAGLTINLVVSIIVNILNPKGFISLILSIGIALFITITIITCLNSINYSYATTKFEELPSAFSTLCIVLGVILTIAGLLSLGDAFKHVIFTIQFLNFICNAVLYFSIAGLIKDYNARMDRALRENVHIFKKDNGNLEHHLNKLRCNRCNTKNAEGSKNCTNCGAPLEQ